MTETTKLFSSTFLLPENIAIDANIDNEFSWQPGGNTQVAYQIYIYKNSDNTIVYDSTKITSSDSSHTINLSTLTNGLEYKWFVRTWWDATSYVDSDWAFFKTNTTPTVTMNLPIDSIIEFQNYTFTANYNQSESIPLKQFKFILYDEFDNIISDTDWVYSNTAEYEITGLTNNSTYQIECQIINQNNMTATTDKNIFYTDYHMPVGIPGLDVTPLNDEGLMRLDWTGIIQVLATVDGEYSFVDGKFDRAIQLELGSVLTYNQLIPEEYTMTFWIQLPSSFEGVFIQFNNDFKIGYDGERFFYDKTYRITAGQKVSLPEIPFLVGVKSSKILITFDGYSEIIV